MWYLQSGTLSGSECVRLSVGVFDINVVPKPGTQLPELCFRVNAGDSDVLIIFSSEKVANDSLVKCGHD